MLGEIFVGVLFAASIYFAYLCGKVDCRKNSYYKGGKCGEE